MAMVADKAPTARLVKNILLFKILKNLACVNPNELQGRKYDRLNYLPQKPMKVRYQLSMLETSCSIKYFQDTPAKTRYNTDFPK